MSVDSSDLVSSKLDILTDKRQTLVANTYLHTAKTLRQVGSQMSVGDFFGAGAFADALEKIKTEGFTERYKLKGAFKTIIDKQKGLETEFVRNYNHALGPAITNGAATAIKNIEGLSKLIDEEEIAGDDFISNLFKEAFKGEVKKGENGILTKLEIVVEKIMKKAMSSWSGAYSADEKDDPAIQALFEAEVKSYKEDFEEIIDGLILLVSDNMAKGNGIAKKVMKNLLAKLYYQQQALVTNDTDDMATLTKALKEIDKDFKKERLTDQNKTFAKNSYTVGHLISSLNNSVVGTCMKLRGEIVEQLSFKNLAERVSEDWPLWLAEETAGKLSQIMVSDRQGHSIKLSRTGDASILKIKENSSGKTIFYEVQGKADTLIETVSKNFHGAYGVSDKYVVFKKDPKLNANDTFDELLIKNPVRVHTSGGYDSLVGTIKEYTSSDSPAAVRRIGEAVLAILEDPNFKYGYANSLAAKHFNKEKFTKEDFFSTLQELLGYVSFIWIGNAWGLGQGVAEAGSPLSKIQLNNIVAMNLRGIYIPVSKILTQIYGSYLLGESLGIASNQIYNLKDANSIYSGRGEAIRTAQRDNSKNRDNYYTNQILLSSGKESGEKLLSQVSTGISIKTAIFKNINRTIQGL